PEEVVVGTHGLFITLGFHRGVLLPQVPVEWGWDRLEYLDHLCQKAGLPVGTWREPEVELESFTAQVFSEE
ncbi:AMMECR1 family protein, partial [Myxococcota bacterium]|nr:AMMECR1 family protein [Myxococcota bacterium]